MPVPSTESLGPTRDEGPRASDGLAVAAVGLLLRLAVVAWAASRFPPAEDGHYYHVVATRIAEGLGYTWLWPDGAVTYAAHYPVGYPALIGGLYALFGEHPAAAMVLNSLLGAASAWAAHRVAASVATRRGAIVAGLSIAAHPGLVFYTPALMTEGTALSLLTIAAAWVTSESAATKRSRALGVTLLLGLSTLVRPPSLLLAPFYGFLLYPDARLRLKTFSALAVTAGAILVCAPWTVRNCRRMNACVLVSANAGWNLFIGAAEGATGTFVPLERLGVPAECRTVWGEADKDACFGAAARRRISTEPVAWASLVPAKLAATFDYAGAAGWYLHTSNPTAFSETAKAALGVAETLWQRLILLASLVAAARASGPRVRARRAISALSAVPLVLRAAWLSHIGLLVVLSLLGRRVLRSPYGVVGATLLSTVVIHAVFFGGGRYSLVCFPMLGALAGCMWVRPRLHGDDPGAEPGRPSF